MIFWLCLIFYAAGFMTGAFVLFHFSARIIQEKLDLIRRLSLRLMIYRDAFHESEAKRRRQSHDDGDDADWWKNQ